MQRIMKELLFFSNLKTLIKAEYLSENNTIKYSSHKKLSANEKRIIERYLLSKFARNTEYYQRYPSFLVYSGVEKELKRDLKLLQLKKVLKVMAVHEQEVKEKVDELINSSLSNYYFERIGDTILEMRRYMQEGKIDKLMFIEKTKKDIKELIEAYNNYSENKISIEKVIPHDLIEFFN